MGRVGEYELVSKIGSGGMGHVWLADRDGRRCAVKLVDAAEADLFREVHAMASLTHPNIATVYDYGRLAEASGEIRAGTSWIAMEYAEHGTLNGLSAAHRAQWVEIARQILQGLAHAHARRITHRDLKPANILVANLDPLVLKIADFGLAHDAGNSDIATGFRTSGTPRFMSPEQALGDLRDQGPWTDLYGFGCLMWWVLTGSTPFMGETVEDILRAHLHTPLPLLPASLDLPDDVQIWFSRLLRKRRLERFQFAADALDELTKLAVDVAPATFAAVDEPTIVGPTPVGDPHATAPNVVPPTLSADSDVQIVYDPGAGHAFRRELGELPEWRQGVSLLAPEGRVSLFGVRGVPIVDRDAEREACWDTLRAAHGGAVRHVRISGPRGEGKSKLLDWFVTRSHELGAARSVVVQNAPHTAPEVSLAHAVALHFGCQNLSRAGEPWSLGLAETRDRVAHVLGAHGIESDFAASEIAQFVHHTLSAEPTRHHERRGWFSPLADYFGVLATERPLIFAIDDHESGAESVAFAGQLLARSGSVVVVTAGESAATDLGAASVDVRVAALDDGSMEDLLGQMLRLDPSTSSRLVAASSGNPLFATQMLGDWVQNRLLTRTPSGWAVPDDLSFPGNLAELWQERLLTVERRLAGEGLEAVEVAAMLGFRVESWLWREVCARRGFTPSPILVENLAELGVISLDEDGWTFRHRGMVDALCRRAEEQDRLASMHRTAAEVMEGQLAESFAHSAEIARHWIGAGAADKALPHLRNAAEGAARAGTFDRVSAIWDEHDRLAAYLGPDERARGLIGRARNLMMRADVAELEALLDEAEALLDEVESPEVVGDYHCTRGRLSRIVSSPEQTIGHCLRALDAYQKVGAAKECAEVDRLLGEAYRQRADIVRARAKYESSLAFYETTGDDFLAGWCEFGLAVVAKIAGDRAEAWSRLQNARRAFEDTHSRMALASVHNELGEIARAGKERAVALDYYGRVLSLLSSEHAYVAPTLLNVALCHLSLGRRDGDLWTPTDAERRAAREQLERSAALIQTSGRRDAFAYTLVGLLLCDVLDGSRHEARRRWEALQDEDFPVEEDLAEMLEQSAIRLPALDERELALKIFERARLTWSSLGREERVRGVDRRVTVLDGRTDESEV